MDPGEHGTDPQEDPFGIAGRQRARRNMVPLVGGQAVSLFGDYIAFFSLPYFVLSLTGKPLDLGLTAAAETLPMLLFGLAAGVILDRWRNLKGALVAVDIAARRRIRRACVGDLRRRQHPFSRFRCGVHHRNPVGVLRLRAPDA